MVEVPPGIGLAAAVGGLALRRVYGRYESLPETRPVTADEKIRNHREILRLAAEGNVVHDVLAKAIASRLENPAMARRLTGKWFFTPLGREYQKLKEVLQTEDSLPETQRKSPEDLAAEVRSSVATVYNLNGVNGRKIFQALRSDDIITDARDYAGTVARELFTGEYLTRVAREQRIAEELYRQCKPDVEKYHERIDRHKIITRMLDEKKAKRSTRREMNRVARQLRLSGQEREDLQRENTAQQQVAASIEVDNTINEAELAAQILERKNLLEKQTLDGLSVTAPGQAGAAIDTVQDASVLEEVGTVEETDNIFLHDATAQLELYWKRQDLAKAAQSLKIGATVEAINIVQKSEAQVRSAERKRKSFERVAEKDATSKMLLRKAIGMTATISQEGYIRGRIINQRAQNFFLRNYWKYQDFIWTRVHAPNIDRVRTPVRRARQNIIGYRSAKKPQVAPEASPEKPTE